MIVDGKGSQKLSLLQISLIFYCFILIFNMVFKGLTVLTGFGVQAGFWNHRLSTTEWSKTCVDLNHIQISKGGHKTRELRNI